MDVYLTFDIDWAHDTVIAETLEIINSYGVRATWFATHPTPMNAEIAASGQHEMAVHPNFNPLLEGNGGDMRSILGKAREIIPDSKAIRSHSLVKSSKLSYEIRNFGFTHESNYFIPPATGINIQAWKDWLGIVQVPIRWIDDVYLYDRTIRSPYEFLDKFEVLVVDFHPIHIFMNTMTLDDYENTRSIHRDPHALLQRRRPAGSGGSRDHLIALLEGMTQASSNQKVVSECEPR